MAEAEKPAPATPAEDVIEEARSSAAGTRKAAAWMATALGGIPSIGILTSVVRDPGELGFNESQLECGIALAAAGGVLGVLAFAWVMVPVRLEDSKLTEFKMERIPGHPFKTFAKLTESIERLRDARVEDEDNVLRAARESEAAKAKAAGAEAAAVVAEAEAEEKSEDAKLKAKAEKLRAAANLAAVDATGALATAAKVAAGHASWGDGFERRQRIRADAYRLKAADIVKCRFIVACVASVVAVGLIAAGVIQLAKAPIPKPDAAAATAPVLMTLTPNKDGQDALGCPSVTTVQALKVGGTEDAPSVITLPQPDCPPKTLVFPTSTPKKLGRAEPVKPVKLAVEDASK